MLAPLTDAQLDSGDFTLDRSAERTCTHEDCADAQHGIVLRVGEDSLAWESQHAAEGAL